MNIAIYDTYNEYIASTSYSTDDLCFIKNLGTWYQGGKVKTEPIPYKEYEPVPGSPCMPKPCCPGQCPPPCPPPGPKGICVIHVGDVAYWGWDGYLIKDDNGDFVPVYSNQDTMTKAEIKAYIESLMGDYATKDYVANALSGYATKDYVTTSLTPYATKEYVANQLANYATKIYVDNKFANLAKICVNGTTYNLNDGGTIYINTESSTIPVSSISLNKSTTSILVGGNDVLVATILPTNATDQTVTWTTSNSAIATVTSGVVIGVSVGSAVITAASNNGKYASCVVTVTSPTPTTYHTITWVAGTGVTGNTQTTSVIDGTTISTLSIPSGFSLQTGYTNMHISSSVTTVTSDITITVIADKETPTDLYTITKNLDAHCTINNSADTTPGGVTYDAAIDVNDSAYEVDDVKCTMEGGGLVVVTGNIISISSVTGNIVITATSKSKEVAVTSVTVDPTSYSLTVGGTKQLSATVLPTTATDKTITWSTSNSSVATVSNGLVTGIAAGTAVITAKSNNGKYGTCNITVTSEKISVTSVSLNKSSMTIDVGATDTLVATVLPENATDKSVTWSTSDSTKATVNNGTVTGVAVGTCTITITTTDGNKTATCEVTVKEVAPVTTYKAYAVMATEDLTSLPSSYTEITSNVANFSGESFSMTTTEDNQYLNLFVPSGTVLGDFKMMTVDGSGDQENYIDLKKTTTASGYDIYVAYCYNDTIRSRWYKGHTIIYKFV